MLKRLLVGSILIASSTPAMADIVIDQAMITAGELRVIGRLSRPRQISVFLDERFETKADANGRFTFRIPYHPATCIVNLQAENEQRQAVIGFCGQRGPEGSGATQQEAAVAQAQSGLQVRKVLKGSPVATERPVRKVLSALRGLRAHKGLPAWRVRVVRSVRSVPKDPQDLRDRPATWKRKQLPEASRALLAP